MALTRSAVDGVLLKRTSALLVQSGLGTDLLVLDPIFADSIGWALRTLGFATAAINAVTDNEVAQATGLYVDALLDLSELRLLETIQQNLTKVDAQAGLVREGWSQLGKRLDEYIKAKRRNASVQYGELLVRPIDGGSGAGSGTTVLRIAKIEAL